MKHMTLARTAIGMVTGALLLAACGGGGGSGETAATPPPPSDVAGTDIPVEATTSSAAAVAFVKSVTATSDNTAEPLRAGDATLATSDSDEPDAGV
jgi:ABC-type glycerol-3-phosphate transport system substrate-binding protein